MKESLDNRVVIGVVVVVLIGVLFFGYRIFAGGTKAGQKPELDPTLNRMYGPHPLGSAPGQTNTSGQGH